MSEWVGRTIRMQKMDPFRLPPGDVTVWNIPWISHDDPEIEMLARAVFNLEAAAVAYFGEPVSAWENEGGAL